MPLYPANWGDDHPLVAAHNAYVSALTKYLEARRKYIDSRKGQTAAALERNSVWFTKEERDSVRYRTDMTEAAAEVRLTFRELRSHHSNMNSRGNW